MKPAKKQNSTKTDVNDKSSAPGIKTYFKTAPKSFKIDNVPDASVKPNDDAKQFYVDILKDKLKGVHNKGVEDDTLEELQEFDEPITVESGGKCSGCVEKLIEIDDWKSKYDREVAHHKEYKRLYLNSTVQFSELHSKYNDLLKTTAALPKILDDATTSQDMFTSNEVKYLQCMPLDKKTDCTFILSALKFVYKADLTTLTSKTLKGTSERIEILSNGDRIHHPAKDPMTPLKVSRIKSLFIERIAKCEISSPDYAERMKDAYVNKLFAAGIRNLSNKSN